MVFKSLLVGVNYLKSNNQDIVVLDSKELLIDPENTLKKLCKKMEIGMPEMCECREESNKAPKPTQFTSEKKHKSSFNK